MCHHFGGIGGGKDRSSETDNAIHRECVWRNRLVDSANKRDGARNESATGVFRECENIEEQQLFEVWEVFGAAIQCAGRASGGEYHKLSVGEKQGCGTDNERAEFSYFLSVYKGGIFEPQGLA